MTKKHYILLANRIKEQSFWSKSNKQKAIESLCILLQNENSKFNKETFILYINKNEQ